VSVHALRERKPLTFVVAGDPVLVRVRESRRARTLRIIVGPRRPLEVIIPRGAREADAARFLEAKRGWVEEKVAAARATAARPFKLGLERPGGVWLEGEPVLIERRDERRSVAELRGAVLVVSGPEGGAAAALERWYRRAARRRIAEVAEREAARLELTYRSIGVRDQRTRWGSCSRRGNLSFSWRLLVAPADVLEYVVVHELCHLGEPNHSKAFWRLLDAARPGWQEQARWLREHGQELHDYRPSAAFR